MKKSSSQYFDFRSTVVVVSRNSVSFPFGSREGFRFSVFSDPWSNRRSDTESLRRVYRNSSLSLPKLMA